MLARLIQDFVQLARKDPAQASAPSILAKLDKESNRMFADAVCPRPVLLSTDKMEVSTVLKRTSLLSSARIPFSFPIPVEIVGFSCYIRPTFDANEGPFTDPLEFATLADVLVSVDVNNARIRTNQSQTTPGGPPGQFVTLESLDQKNSNTLSGLRIKNARPELGFTFRWKEFTGANPVYWKSSAVTVVCHWNRLDDDDGR